MQFLRVLWELSGKSSLKPKFMVTQREKNLRERYKFISQKDISDRFVLELASIRVKHFDEKSTGIVNDNTSGGKKKRKNLPFTK